jgi:rhamnosyl/mannosyltransferase
MTAAGTRTGPVTVIVPLPPSYRGGTEEYAYRVAARVHREIPVRIVTTDVRAGQDPVHLPVEGLELQTLHGRELFQRPVVSGTGRKTLRRLVESSGLIHLHMPFPWIERQVAVWARRHGIPVVLTYHMDADFAAATGLRAAAVVTSAYRQLSALPALRRSDAVVSNSAGYARASPVLKRFLPKVKVIAKGVDVDRLGISPGELSAPHRPAADPELFPGCGPESRRVVFVGRLVAYKGLPVLVEAVRRLVAQGGDVRLFIAGRGPLLGALQSQVLAAKLTEHVRFLGFVPDDRLGSLYRGADVVACPSVSLLESTATCLEEAAACGVPVLGSALPGTEETVPSDGIHGYLARPRDPDSVTEGLRLLLSRPRPGDRLPFRTWDDTARQYVALFCGLLPHGP